MRCLTWLCFSLALPNCALSVHPSTVLCFAVSEQIEAVPMLHNAVLCRC